MMKHEQLRIASIKPGTGARIIAATFLLLIPVLFRPFVHGPDAVGYYAWLRQAVIEHTLDVGNAFRYYAAELSPPPQAPFNLRTPTGYTHDQWASGSAILWSPMYLAAHSGVLLARALGANIPADGYSWPYPLAAGLASALYGLAAIWLTYQLARHLVGEFAATVAALVSWLATPTVFYMYCQPLISHANDAFVNALFVYVWWRTRETYASRAGWIRGLIAGLAMWVRPQNAVVIALLGLETLVDLVITWRSKSHPKPVLLRGLVTLAGFMVAIAPLLLFWRIVYGAWIVNTYTATQGSAIFDWRAPHLVQVLFSSNRGLFVWAPVTLPALAGLWRLFKIHTRLAALLVGMFMAQLYVIGSWFDWSGAISFGPRFWVNMTIVFGMGLAALITQRWPRPMWIALAGIFVIWNLLLIVQYSLNTVPHSGTIDLVKMIQQQFTIIPENLPRIVRALTARR